jgi:hypothetical protein
MQGKSGPVGRFPMLEMCDESGEPTSDPALLSILPEPAPPIRLLIFCGWRKPTVETLRQWLKVDSVESPYHQARVLEISFRTSWFGFGFDAWLEQAKHGSGRVIWVIADIPGLELRGLYEPLLEILRENAEFIAFADSDRITSAHQSGASSPKSAARLEMTSTSCVMRGSST